MKLLLAIPTTDYMHHRFTECLTKLIRRLDADGVDYDVMFQSGTLVYHARDAIAFKAIDGGYTHSLWLDSDMIFTEHVLDDLRDANKGFVSGIAHGRREPHHSCLFTEIYPSVHRFTEYPNDTFKVAGCGFGCVLISSDILAAVRKANGTCFFPTRELGEDLAFCKRATDLGYEIWAEPTVRLGHIGHINIYPEYRDMYVKTVQGLEGKLNGND